MAVVRVNLPLQDAWLAPGTQIASLRAMRLRTLLSTLSLLAGGLTASNVAHADCALPRSYQPSVDGNAVTVCPTDPDSHATPGCPATGGMLRVDVADGGVVRLADVCTDAGAYTCYVDPCVGPGTHQYGYGTPYECASFACNTAYFVQVSVTQPLTTCTSDAAAPVPVSSAPWDSGVPVTGQGNAYGVNPNCPYSSGGLEGGPADDAGPSDAGAVDAVAPQADAGETDAAIHGSAGDAGTTRTTGNGAASSGGGGCAIAALPGAERAVLAIDGLALVVGMGLFIRRRRGR